MYTFQDFEKQTDKVTFARKLIDYHKSTDIYNTAKNANAYDKQKNITVNEYVKKIYTMSGSPVVDFTASNNKIASNFFNRLNTQRNTYSLGNGVTFLKEDTKDKLGKDFDDVFQDAGYKALIHGVSFIFFNNGNCYNFDITEFVPLLDENTGDLRAGVRFWQLDSDKPLMFTIYEEDGYSKYKCISNDGEKIIEIEPKRAYKIIKKTVKNEVIEEQGENYSKFPIVQFYGSRLKQSTLVGMQQSIDSFDLIRSGFANDLTDVAQIYWLLSGCDGMTDSDLQRFRDRLLLNHIALGGDENTKIEAHTQEIPFEARIKYLENIRKGIYEDFGGLDVLNFSNSDKTTVEIKACYQSMDENADDFEKQARKAIRVLLELIGVDDYPIFKRNMITNESDVVEMVIKEKDYLDFETILKKLPNVAEQEIADIIKKKTLEDMDKFNNIDDGEEETE